MKTKLLLLLLFYFSAVKSQTGSVGINNANPNVSAVLDITSDTKGLLIPRLTTAAVANLSSTASEGLMVYDKDKHNFLGWDGIKWQILGNVSVNLESLAAWEFSGNTGFGISPASPIYANSAVSSATIERGFGLGTSGAGAANTFGGSGWDQVTLDASTTNGDFLLVTFNLAPGKTVSFNKINFLNLRRSASGPNVAQWQYSTDGIGYFNVGTPIAGLNVVTTAGNNVGEKNLAIFSDLQNIDTDTVTKIYFRLAAYNNSGGTTGGNFYINNISGNDLEFTGVAQ